MLLKQNGKLKKTANATGIDVFNFGIPAFKSDTGLITCPNAKYCVAGCYARSGTYGFGVVKKAQEERLKLTLDTPAFIATMGKEISTKLKTSERRKHKLYIRIHDSGDFYSEVYLNAWLDIMRIFPMVQFYAYTKQVAMMQKFTALQLIPDNFTLIFSHGGKQDHLIKPTDRQAKVFETLAALKRAKYANGTENDMVAAKGKNHLIGLVYHGVKSYKNTTWEKVRV